MPIAEILAIGTELLLGETQDTNTRWIARRLRDEGIDIFRTSMVGDNTHRIAGAIQDALQRADFIITTGGLGPTVDDPTRQAVALAAGVRLEYYPALWEQILDRFRRYNREPSENNRRQAYMPLGSQVIENQVGTAPSFITLIGGKPVISLPGVPREMEWAIENRVLPFLRQHFQLEGTIQARLLHLAGLGESLVDEKISDLELLSNPTVGLAAHSGQVDIRITAKAATLSQANLMLTEIETEIRHRLGAYIYGTDQDTLPKVILHTASLKNISIALVDCGAGGELTRQLVEAGYDESLAQVLPSPDQTLDLESTLAGQMQKTGAAVGLGLCYLPGTLQQELHLVVISTSGRYTSTHYYGGPPANGVLWSLNMALDYLRRNL